MENLAAFLVIDDVCTMFRGNQQRIRTKQLQFLGGCRNLLYCQVSWMGLAYGVSGYL